jgi:mannosyltransferase OCH1-like enzyme
LIPKTLHIIWVGDEFKRPDNCIQTWRDHNPGWTVRVWGNEELGEYGWVNARHMRQMQHRELCGVADLKRWEILYNEGGFVVDADSVCTRALPDWLLECEAFASWESELMRPGLIASGYVASVPGNPFFGQMILDLQALPDLGNERAWKIVGPQFLTDCHRKYRYSGLTLWPSHFFLPRHFTGLNYQAGGLVFADQAWASTLQGYDVLHTLKVA